MSTAQSSVVPGFRVPMVDNWYVKNGDAVVGPVGIELLVKGVARGKIAEDCQVRQEDWTTWRELDGVRELAALRRAPPVANDALESATAMTPYLETSCLLATSSDAREAMLLTMYAAVRASCASVALLHRLREPYIGLVTSCAHGLGADILLGSVISREDPALLAARLGVAIVGHASLGHTEARVAERLGLVAGPLAEVAMFPIRSRGALLGMLELGRADHAFRREDLGAVADIVDALLDYFERHYGSPDREVRPSAPEEIRTGTLHAVPHGGEGAST